MKILKEELTADFSPAFDIVTREIELPEQGVITRYVVRHKPVVSILVYDQEEEVFYMGKEYRSGVNEYRLGNPAGYIDEGETPEQAAQRELREELGLITEYALDDMGQISSSEGFTDEEVHLSLALGPFKKVDTEFDEGEFVELVPVKKVDALQMLMQKEILSAPTVTSLLMFYLEDAYYQLEDMEKFIFSDYV